MDYPGCIGGAEALLNLQPNSSLSVSYHPLFGPHDDLMLLELDEKLLPDVLNHRVTLRGQQDEDAVLCTQSKTYAVKFVGTSNSVFLVPPSDQSALRETPQDCNEKYQDKMAVASVFKLAPGNMELVEIAPRLDKLKLLLLENPYKFDEKLESEVLDGMVVDDTSLYRWGDLIDRVQASDEQLRSGLQTLSAVEIDGYWRIVDEQYMEGLLNMLLHNSILNDWSFTALVENEIVGVLESDGYPRAIAHHCLQVYGSKEHEKADGRSVWKIDERRVCVQFARGILREGKVKLERFMETWRRKVPEEIHVNFDMLEGEILIEKLGVETWIYPFSVASLPFSPADRFAILFKEQPKWEWKDLQPYIRDLSVPGLSSEALLLKYTRRTQPTPEAEPIFTAR